MDALTKVGVVGLGMMGGGIARSLVAAGFDPAVHDVRRDVVDELAAFDVTVCATPAAVAAVSDVVVVVVFDSAQVEDVLFASDGLVPGARSDLVIMVCSTIDPQDIEGFARRAAAEGVTMIDVGIAGGPDAAASGGLVTLVGGDEAAVAVARPLLDAMSVEVVHAGPVGAGMKLKLVKNTMSYLTMCAVHEALLLGEELGFDSELVRHVAETSNLVDHFFWFPMSRPSARPLPVDADPAAVASAEFFAGVARKDLEAARAVGRAASVDLPVTELAQRLAERFFLLAAERPDP